MTCLKNTASTRGAKRSPSRNNDRSKIQCFNCLKFGHFASKCPEPKRDRKQRSTQLKTMMAQTSPMCCVYTDEEMGTPEAIRDSLRDAMSGFLAEVMFAIDPALEANQTIGSTDEGGTQDPAGEYETLDEHAEDEEHERSDNTHIQDEAEIQRAERDLHAILHDPEEEDPANQETEGDAESVYTYSEEGVHAATASLALHAQVAQLQLKQKGESAEAARATEEDDHSETTTSDEESLPEKWSFTDCADKPDWGEDALEKLSLLADLVIPRVEHLARRKGITSDPLPFDHDEVTQMCSWTCMLNITTHGEWTEIMVALLASAVKAWKKGRSARRRLLQKCKRLERHLGPRPMTKSMVQSEYTACIQRASEQELIRSVFVAAGLSTPCGKETTTRQSTESGINYIITTDAAADTAPTCILLHVHAEGMSVPTPRKGYTHVSTATSSRQAWEFISTMWSGGERPPTYVVDPMQILVADKFWTQYNIPVRHDLHAGSKLPSPERNEVAGAIRMLPLRMTVAEEDQKGVKAGHDKRLSQLMEQTKRTRSFVLAGPDKGVPAAVLSSWLGDTGTEVSQISPQAAERMWQAITIIQSAKMRCVTAFSTKDKKLRLCRLTGLRLWDPDKNTWTQAVDTFAFINSTLAAYECILGTNTIVDMGLVIDVGAGTVRTREGVSVPMLTERQVHRWRTLGREPMLLTPDKHAAAADDEVKTRKNTKSSTTQPKTKKGIQNNKMHTKASHQRDVARNKRRLMTKLSGGEYTHTDRMQLAKAKQLAHINEVQAVGMFDKVAVAALKSQSEEVESPLPYQPCRRLVRVADILDESSMSEGHSALGGWESDSSHSQTPASKTKPEPAKVQTYMPAYFTPKHKKARDSESPIWAEAYAVPEGVSFTPEGARPAGSQIPAEGSGEVWTPIAQTTAEGSGTHDRSDCGSAQLMQQTRELFNSPANGLDESAVLLRQTRALFNTPVWKNEHWEQYTKLERKRVEQIQKEYEDNYVRYQALARRATGEVPPYVWPHDADIDRVGRARVTHWMQQQMTALRAEADARLQRDATEQRPPLRYTPLFAGEPNIPVPVTLQVVEHIPMAVRTTAKEAGKPWKPPTQARNQVSPDDSDEFPLDEGFVEALDEAMQNVRIGGSDHTKEPGEQVLHGLLASITKPHEYSSLMGGRGTLLQQAVSKAASYGSYMPVKIGNKVMIWHADSGASLTQVSPDQLLEFDPPLVKVDEGSVHFKSAENASATHMGMYIAKLALIQMESGITTEGVDSIVVCNHKLQKGTKLLGLNSFKDLRLSECFANDTLLDQQGRPFRKFAQTSLRVLQQQVGVWNRKRRNASAYVGKADPTANTRASKPTDTDWKDAEATPVGASQAQVHPTQKELHNDASKADSEQDKEERKKHPPDITDRREHVFKHNLFNARSFDKAERDNNTRYFRQCVLSSPHATHLWAAKSGKSYVKFRRFVADLQITDPDLWREYQNMTSSKKKKKARVSARRRRVSVLQRQSKEEKRPGEEGDRSTKTTTGSRPQEQESQTSRGRESEEPHDRGPTTAQRNMSNKVWVPDPTPPHLTEVLTVPKQALPEQPLEIHPDLFWSLAKKAAQRWDRHFDTMSSAGCVRLRSGNKGDKWIPNKHMKQLNTRTMLIIPSPKSIRATLKRVIAATRKSPETAVLFLLPQSLMENEEVSTFMHAYASRGETYRQGPLFKRVGTQHYLQLNQAVHEFWLDPAGERLPNLTPAQQAKLDKLLYRYRNQVGDANTSAAARQKNAESHIPYVRLPVKKDFKPGADAPFKKNPTVRQLTIDFVRDMQQRGLVSRCTAEEATFVCNSLMLPKDSGKYRFVCTFTQLNANILKDPYGMRTLDAVMTAMEGSTWFSVLDIVDGFFNLPLYPADRGFTAFHTPIGVFKWNVLPQGTAASPQIFQRTMDKWFAAYLWKSVIVWMDDLLVHSRSFHEHLRHLEQVLQVAEKYGLVFNKQKLKLCQRSVKYIGYIFGVGGIRADPSKVEDVHNLPAPKTPKQVRQFLGFAGFYRRFMPPNYANIIAPLTNLTKKGVPFEWGEACQKGFERVKLLLTTTPVLTHPDFKLPFHIHCDACGKGVGAVLSQYVDGAYRPIAFCSKRLLPHQVHWAPAQLEAYAIYYAVCIKWRYYLSLNKVIVHTDHRNLSWLFNQAQKGMIGRWYAHLCAYDLDITYVQGRTQVVADPLSRLLRPPTPAPEWAQPAAPTPMITGMKATLANLQQEPAPFTINGCAAHVRVHEPKSLKAADGTAEQSFRFLNAFMNTRDMVCTLPRATWAERQRGDPRLGPIYSYLTRTVTTVSLPSPEWVRIAAQSYRVHGGLLQYRSLRQVGHSELSTGWVLAVVPASLQQKVIRECHMDGVLGHHGTTKTILAVRQRYHFKKLRAAVTRFVSKCVTCIRAKAFQLNDATPLSPMFAPDPFNAIAVDLYKPGTTLANGYRYVLTVVDMCTRWVQFVPLKSKYAAEVMLALCHTWFAMHGVPQFILSDRGKEFMGVVTTVCTAAKIKQIRTTPQHPQSNGLCEVQHKTLTRELKIRSARRQQPVWSDLLPEIQFAINVSTDDLTPGISPFQLVFGRKPRLAGEDVTFPSKVLPSPNVPEDKRQYVQQLCRRMQEVKLAGLERQLHRKQRQRDRHDQHRKWQQRTRPKRGDLVYRHHKTGHPKLQYQWSGPTWLVVSVSSNKCMLKPLTSVAGRKGMDVPSIPTNLKNIRIASDRPVDFWIGARVRRRFSDSWFQGTVMTVTTDEGETLYRVIYDDCDQEDLDRGQLWDSVIFHPRMCEAEVSTLPLPKINSVVLFSHDQKPRLGKVTHVDEEAQRPITIHLWKPNKNRNSLYQARYKPSSRFVPSSMNEEADLIQLRPEQVKLRNLEFDSDGRLKQGDRERFKRYLSKHALTSRVSPQTGKATRKPAQKETAKSSATVSTSHHRSRPQSERRARSRVMESGPARAQEAGPPRDSQPVVKTRSHSRYHLRPR